MVGFTTAVVSVAKFQKKKSASMCKGLLEAATTLIVERYSIIRELITY